jgi:hypothetical protein
MSRPDVIDERFDALVQELRAARPATPGHVRERVRAIAARPAVPTRRPRRRLRWALAPAAAVAVAAAVTVAVVDSSHNLQQRDLVAGEKAVSEAQQAGDAAQSPLLRAAPAPERQRAQLYAATITLKVGDLSQATKRALRVTRSLGGHIRSIDYGSAARAGTAVLVLRVPVGRVQEAIAGYNELGRILDQHVSVRDVQPQLDRRFTRIQALKRDIAALSHDSSTAALTRRDQLEAELAVLQTAQAAQRTKAALATVSLQLRTKQAALTPPAPPGRIERALDDAVGVLAAEAEALVYALVVGAPFVLAGLALIVLARAHRRRADERLLGYP